MALKPLNSVAGFSVGQTPTTIISANGDMTANNFTVTGVSNLNNISNVLIYGGTSGQVITTDGNGNLSWSATGSPSSINHGNSNVNIPVINGNIYINANASVDQQWIFDTSGILTLAGTGVITAPVGTNIDIHTGNGASYSEIYLADNGNVTIATQGEIYNWIFDTTGNLTLPGSSYIKPATGALNLTDSTGNSYIDIDTNNIYLYTDYAGSEYEWNFSNTGNTTFPAIGTANLGNLVTANYANFANDVVVQGNIANANNITVTNNITSDTSNVTGNLTAGNVDGGNLVKANNFSTNGSGGDITLSGGNIQGANLVIANSFTSNGGLVDFNTNNANVQLGSNANVHLYGGSSGQVLTTDGSGNLSWSSAGSVTEIYNGNSNVSIPVADGNIYINANASVDQQWVFLTTGNLTTPGNIELGGTSINDNSGDGIQLFSTNYAEINYNNTSQIYVESDGAWLDTGSGTLHLDTSGNVTISQNLSVLGNIANANNITATNDLSVGGNITTGSGSGGNVSGVNYLFANVANISNTVITGKIANGTSNIRLDLNGNITISSNNSSNVFTFSDLGANVLGYIQANGIISAGGFEGSNLVSNVGILSLQAKQTGGDYNINLLAGGAGNVDVGSTYITSLHDPLNAQDAATKNYVDTVAQGLNVHQSANLGTTTDLATTLGIPSGNVVYAQPGPEGVGATLTFTGNSLTSLDGNSVTSGMRLLIKNESNAAWNGVYDIGANALFITRSIDESYNANFAGGDFLFIQSGATLADTGWVQTTDNVIIGTSNIVFQQFSGVGVYTGANGILVSGTVISANVDNVTTAIIGGNIAVADSAQLVTPNIGAATGTSLNLSGNVLAGNLNSNATVTGVDASFTGNVEVGGNITTTGSQGNIEGANTIFSDSFVSNGGLVDFNTNSANVQLGSNANVHLYGGSDGQVLKTDGAGNLTWYTISTSSIQNGNSNVTIPTTDGNVYINANSGTDKQWAFGTDGTLTFPLVNGQTAIQTQRYGMGNLLGVSDGGWVLAEYNGTAYGTEGIRISPGIEGNVEVILPSDANAAGNSLQLNNYVGNVTIDANSNYWNFDSTGNTTFPASGAVNLGNVATANTVNVGPLTQITYGNTTTVSITANQTIASLNVAGITGAEFLVKAIDAGGKYSVATVLAVTDGTTADYSIYGTTQIGGYTGSLAVNVTGGYLRLQVTPASSNSTVWVTQARTI